MANGPQFSLRTLFVVMFVLSAWLGWISNRSDWKYVRKITATNAGIDKNGELAFYEQTFTLYIDDDGRTVSPPVLGRKAAYSCLTIIGIGAFGSWWMARKRNLLAVRVIAVVALGTVILIGASELVLFLMDHVSLVLGSSGPEIRLSHLM